MKKKKYVTVGYESPYITFTIHMKWVDTLVKFWLGLVREARDLPRCAGWEG